MSTLSTLVLHRCCLWAAPAQAPSRNAFVEHCQTYQELKATALREDKEADVYLSDDCEARKSCDENDGQQVARQGRG